MPLPPPLRCVVLGGSAPSTDLEGAEAPSYNIKKSIKIKSDPTLPKKASTLICKEKNYYVRKQVLYYVRKQVVKLCMKARHIIAVIETSNNLHMSITWLSGQLHVRVLWPILPHLRQLIGSGSSTKGRALPPPSSPRNLIHTHVVSRSLSRTTLVPTRTRIGNVYRTRVWWPLTFV